jgi:tRNA A-37 threonylcarbamoyl transferase component Bud32
MTDTHPGPDQLAAFRLGKLGEDELAAIEGHVAACASCCRSLKSLPDDSFISLVRQSSEPSTAGASDPGRSPCSPGERTQSQGEAVTDPGPVVPQDLRNHPRYEILEKLGQGGMGVVYKARHRLMDRTVALKVLRPGLLDRPDSVERFHREFKGAARLVHPNIVTAYDADQAGASHFLVMEYVPGTGLARLVEEEGPLPVARACTYVRQAALGLAHAFECGMVHRDIKPHNLMVVQDRVKILDFGLARFVSETPAEEAVAGSEADDPADRLTLASTVMGTPDYIAPEQARAAHTADIRADIYSLGCTLYHLLAGHAPFPHGSAVQKVKAHLEQTPPSLTALRPDVPAELVRVLERMLAKDPAERYQTPGEVAEALEPWTAEPASAEREPRKAASPAAPRRRRRLRVAVALGALAVLLTMVVAGIVRLSAGDREIVIETDDPTIEIVVKGDRIVRIVDPKTGKEYRLDRKDLTLSLADGPAGLEVKLDERPVVLRRRGQRIATVRLEERTRPLVRDEKGKTPTAPKQEWAIPADAAAAGQGQIVFWNDLPDHNFIFGPPGLDAIGHNIPPGMKMHKVHSPGGHEYALWVQRFSPWKEAPHLLRIRRITVQAGKTVVIRALEERDGFRPLFNRSDFTGWVGPKGFEKHWEVTGEIVLCKGDPGRNKFAPALFLAKPCANFILTLQWRSPRRPAAAGVFDGQSEGVQIMLHASAPDHAAKKRILLQLHHDCRGFLLSSEGPLTLKRLQGAPAADLSVPKGIKFQLKPRPYGEWNTLNIYSLDGTIKVEINGEHAVTAADCQPRQGFVGLHVHGAETQFRNVHIRELSAPKPEPVVKPRPDAEKLQGQWVLILGKVGDKVLHADKLPKLEFRFGSKEVEMEVTLPGGKSERLLGTYRLDPQNKKIHLEFKDRDTKSPVQIPCSYRWQGEELSLEMRALFMSGSPPDGPPRIEWVLRRR